MKQTEEFAAEMRSRLLKLMPMLSTRIHRLRNPDTDDKPLKPLYGQSGARESTGSNPTSAAEAEPLQDCRTLKVPLLAPITASADDSSLTPSSSQTSWWSWQSVTPTTDLTHGHTAISVPAPAASQENEVSRKTDLEEPWTWAAAETRLSEAYERGGLSAWAQAAQREVEAEGKLERRRRRLE
jgi:hypothetical protein